MEAILNILNSWGVLIAIAGVVIIAFAKSIINIYKLGVMDKGKQVTHDQLISFENEIREDMRGYVAQIQKVVLEACLKIIDSRLKDLDGVKVTANEMQIMKAQMEVEIKNAMEKYDEVKALSDSVRVLGNKVSRMEYNDANSTQRRTIDK